MLRYVRRTKHDEFPAIGFDKNRQIVTFDRRSVTSTTMRAVVVTHARPGIGPVPIAAIAGVVIEKLGHTGLLGSQAIVTTRYEFDESAVAQKLKLLANFGFHVLVTWIEIAKMPFERVDFVKGEVALSNRLHAFHDVEQPTARFRRFIPEEERSLPFGQDRFFRPYYSTPDNMNFPGLGNAVEQDF